MFKSSILTFALILLIGGYGFSQTSSKEFTDQAFQFYQQGKLEKAVESAEKAVKIEKSNASKDSASYINAMVNLARINQAYLLELQDKTDDKNLKVSDKIGFYKKSERIAAETEKLLREIVKTNENDGRARTTQTADVKVELAALVQKYNPEPSVQSSRSRIDEAEKLLTEALAVSEQIRGGDDDKTLSIVSQFGDFYYKYVNFEKALPFYERFIETAEKNNKNHPDLENALRSYASIMFITFQDQKASEILKKVERITKKKADLDAKQIFLNLRSRDAVTFSSSVVRSVRNPGSMSAGNNSDFVRVPVKVVVDENGKIIEITAESDNEKIRARAEREVAKWSVRPFSYQGIAHKMRAYLSYFETK